jgi:hypothetical protein
MFIWKYDILSKNSKEVLVHFNTKILQFSLFCYKKNLKASGQNKWLWVFKTTMGLDYEHIIKARAHKGEVKIGKTPKKLASICCP